ncbi:MAG: hypothetical protein M1401_20645 [Chloroflexi bacterium]|nr:hypothetical protein [Chloroflexota bacterium]MCL5111235.1 hypothetical protein [Chloroflexota bacterium]
MYLDTNQSFLEVKWKAKRDRTVKSRLQTGSFVTEWLPDAGDHLDCEVPPQVELVQPKLLNAFYRTTLVNKGCAERVTLDLGLVFFGDGLTIALPGIAIAEVKQDGVDRSSRYFFAWAAILCPTSVRRH